MAEQRDVSLVEWTAGSWAGYSVGTKAVWTVVRKAEAKVVKMGGCSDKTWAGLMVVMSVVATVER